MAVGLILGREKTSVVTLLLDRKTLKNKELVHMLIKKDHNLIVEQRAVLPMAS